LRLTDMVVRGLPAPDEGARVYTDDQLDGFGVRVSQGGTKAFVLSYGRTRDRVTIGRYPVISLADARAEAKRILAEHTLGKHRSKRITFQAALTLFVAEKEQKNRASTIRENERILKKYFVRLHDKQLADLSTYDITGITDKLSRDTPGAALHAFWAARTFLRWCVRRRYIQHSPIEGVEAPSKPGSRERVLTDSELRAVIISARSGGSYGKLVELLALTGQRRGEIASLDASWIDYETRTITIPSTVAKNRREHLLPYGDRVAAILESLPKQGLLFPGKGTDVPFSGFSKAMADFRDACGVQDFTLHDLRRTYATGLARLSVAPQTIEALLNHVTGTLSPLARVYNRHSYLPEAKQAVVQFENYVASLMAAATIPGPE
jgi:integrase